MTVKIIGQEIDHFHLHVIPKYKKDYGYVWMRREKLIPNFKDYEEVEKILGVTKGIVTEKGKTIAKLVSKDQSLDKGHIVIQRKDYLPNEIDEIDLKTWIEVGELLQECIQKTEKGIGSRGFQIQIPLGRTTGIEQDNLSEFQIHLIPRKEIDWSERRWVPEYQRIAEKLRNPDKYVKKFKINEREIESIWKQPAIYLAFTSGIVMVLLSIGIYLMFKKIFE